MADSFVISIAQLNPTVGDIDGNLAKLRRGMAEARDQSADLLVATEMFVSGYPPEDLVLKPSFVSACEGAVASFARETSALPPVLFGTPWRQDGKLYNAAALLADGKIAAVRFKHELPNYGVFDEKRIFAAGPPPGPIVLNGVRLGVMVCEDMWFPAVAKTLRETNAEMIIVINSSPFESDKLGQRRDLAVSRIKETGLPLLYVNQVGAQDELVFDGASFALDAACNLRFQAPSWREAQAVTRWRRLANGWTVDSGAIARSEEGPSVIYHALVLGLSDYVRKNGFPGVVIGLSGGVDSALTAVIAVDALGADKVHCVIMPSPYTSAESLEDATEVTTRLGCELRTIEIESVMKAYEKTLASAFKGRTADTTEENIQARARGITLMALSNKFGWMVLSTGNKSEMSVGYATLYGDMCGGFSVLKDVYKTMVYALCHWRNGSRPDEFLGPAGRVVPDRIITKAPTAELKANQTDQDTLPPYRLLDGILECLVEHDMTVTDVVKRGFDKDTVRKVWAMVDRAEYKRRQAPPGVKITRRAFGRDRRYPITNAFTADAAVADFGPAETPPMATSVRST